MKKLILAALVGVAGLGSGASQAGSTTGNFDVTINLTSGCSLAVITPVDFTYTAFQAGAQASTGGGFNVACSSGLAYAFGLVAGAGGAAPGGATISPTDLGLTYTLTAPAGGTGNGGNQPHMITGTMAGGQAGACAVASCSTTVQHTLVVNF